MKFKIPAPRFKFEVLTEKFDTGIPIVPAALAVGAGRRQRLLPAALEIPHSGPYDLVAWNANQKIFDLREDWWAVKAGRIAMPEVKRIVMVNIGGQVGQNMDTVAQRLVNNEFDSALDMRRSVIGNILAQNPKITTHTGNESPFGYLDWWPNSLWMNTQLEPYNDPKVRRAMSLVDQPRPDQRDPLRGRKDRDDLSLPALPGPAGVCRLARQSRRWRRSISPRKFDLEESAKLMTEAGFTKNGDGLWEKDGATVDATIQGFEGIHSDIVPILVEMLRNGGFDASINFGTDAYQNMADGKPGLYMFGHGASLKDPYAALELFHGRYSASIGTISRQQPVLALQEPGVRRHSRSDGAAVVRRSEVPGAGGQGAGDLLARTDRYSDHPVAPPHRLQPDLLDQLADEGQSRHGHERRLLGADGLARGDEPPSGQIGPARSRGVRRATHTPSSAPDVGESRLRIVSLILRRLGFLALVIWSASTITFFVPRLSSRNAIRERFAELARMGGFSPADMEKIIASMQQQFGLDKPLLQQYADYMGAFCVSISAIRCRNIRRPSLT